MDQQDSKPRLVGINHVALDVGDVDEALTFYGSIFDVRLRGRVAGGAFIDMGDQFVALMQGAGDVAGGHRHVGLVVDDKCSIRKLAERAGARFLDGSSLAFQDPWGNTIEIVEYAEIQFTKADSVLRAMGLALTKSDKALRELKTKEAISGT